MPPTKSNIVVTMKVGLIGRLGGMGGIDKYVNELYKGLKENGIDVQIVWKEEPETPMGKTLHSFLNLPPKVIKESKKFDIIHAIQPGFCVAFPFISKPKIVTFYDFIPIFGRRWVSMKGYLRFFNFLFFSIWMLFAKFSDRMIAISTQTYEELTKFGFSKDKIRFIPIGVDDEFRKLDKRKGKKKILGYLGPLTYRKCVDFVIRSFFHLIKTHELDAELYRIFWILL